MSYLSFAPLGQEEKKIKEDANSVPCEHRGKTVRVFGYSDTGNEAMVCLENGEFLEVNVCDLEETEKILVVISEKHTLLPEQTNLLDKEFGKNNYGFLKVPATGWTKTEIENIKLSGKTFIFVSPVPLLLARVVFFGAQNFPVWSYLFFNEKREATEKSGELKHKIQKSNWELISIC